MDSLEHFQDELDFPRLSNLGGAKAVHKAEV